MHKKRQWIVGITASAKTVMREFQNGTSNPDLRVCKIFITTNPQKSREVKQWLAGVKSIIR